MELGFQDHVLPETYPTSRASMFFREACSMLYHVVSFLWGEAGAFELILTRNHQIGYVDPTEVEEPYRLSQFGTPDDGS